MKRTGGVNKIIILGSMFAIAILLAGFIWWSTGIISYHTTVATSNIELAACSVHKTRHEVIIKNSQTTPWLTTGSLCDTITITNEDPIIRLIAFGPHEHHVPYDGIKEKVLGQQQSLTITLNQVGTYHFHDHIHDSVTGEFIVHQ